MIANDITKGLDGADNLRIYVNVINPSPDKEQGEIRTMEVGWRKGRSCLGHGHHRDVFDACLRWIIDVDRRYKPVHSAQLTFRYDLPTVVRIDVSIGQGGCDDYSGQCKLEEDDLRHRPGPTYLSIGGTLQDLEDAYQNALADIKGEQQ